MPYAGYVLLSVILFVGVHLFAEKARKLKIISQGKFLSICSGVAIAYVFIDLLPKLGKSDLLVQKVLSGLFPYFEKHVFVMALVGFTLFFMVDKSTTSIDRKRRFWLSILSYALFNFLVGYAVVDKDNPEVQPLILFTFAMALHYFTNDYTLSETFPREYQQKGKWILISALFLGWCAGLSIELSKTAVALVSAFIGGGVIMNVTRHELPRENPNSSRAFLFAAALYTVVLLIL